MAISQPTAAPISLFYSYSHEDEALRKKLETHLSSLEAERVIGGWHDRRIEAGTEWDGVISRNLEEAGIILLLVSPDFLASRYCRDVEIARAMERHEAGTARVIPVILRPVDWRSAPFGRLQALPKDARPVAKWKNRDEALMDVARGIREAALSLAAGTRNSSEVERPSARVQTTPSEQSRADEAVSGVGLKHKFITSHEDISDLNREALVVFLSRLAPPSWATYLASIPKAAATVSHNLPIPEQVGQLVRWAESPEGPSLDLLWLTGKHLFPNFR
jgi:TIR domain